MQKESFFQSFVESITIKKPIPDNFIKVFTQTNPIKNRQFFSSTARNGFFGLALMTAEVEEEKREDFFFQGSYLKLASCWLPSLQNFNKTSLNPVNLTSMFPIHMSTWQGDSHIQKKRLNTTVKIAFFGQGRKCMSIGDCKFRNSANAP